MHISWAISELTAPPTSYHVGTLLALRPALHDPPDISPGTSNSAGPKRSPLPFLPDQLLFLSSLGQEWAPLLPNRQHPKPQHHPGRYCPFISRWTVTSGPFPAPTPGGGAPCPPWVAPPPNRLSPRSAPHSQLERASQCLLASNTLLPESVHWLRVAPRNKSRIPTMGSRGPAMSGAPCFPMTPPHLSCPPGHVGHFPSSLPGCWVLCPSSAPGSAVTPPGDPPRAPALPGCSRARPLTVPYRCPPYLFQPRRVKCPLPSAVVSSDWPRAQKSHRRAGGTHCWGPGACKPLALYAL